MCFASLLSGGFITAIVVNPPERKLAKRTSVQCTGNLINAYYNRISTNSMRVDLLVSTFKTKAYFSTVERRKQYFVAIILKHLHATILL